MLIYVMEIFGVQMTSWSLTAFIFETQFALIWLSKLAPETKNRYSREKIFPCEGVGFDRLNLLVRVNNPNLTR